MKHALRRLSAACFLIVIAAVFCAPAVAQEKGRSTLDEILDIMRRGGQITEEQEKELKERAKKEEQSRTLAGIDDNLKPFLRSPGGDFRLELGGFVQFDYDAMQSGARLLTGANPEDTFLVRRARLNMTGQLFSWIGFKIEGDFSTQQNPNFALTDAYIDLNFLPQISLRGGQYKVPFSQEELTSDLFIDTIERSMVNELVPSRDQGFMLQGQFFDRILGYAVGVFNGSGINASDGNNEKDVVGRVTLAPFRNTDLYWLKRLQFSVDGTYGDQDARTSARGRNTNRETNRFQFFAPQPTNGNRYRWGVDLAWLVGPASLKFEYDQQVDQRKKLGPGGKNLDDVTATGWYVTGTWLVTGENAVYNGPVIPRRPFSPLAGKVGPGAWELVLRYQELKFTSDDPVDFFDGNINNGIPRGAHTQENGAEAITAGVNWYLNPRVRAMFNWSEYWYDNSLGTPFSCRQTVCGAGNLRRSHDPVWELSSRIQFWF